MTVNRPRSSAFGTCILYQPSCIFFLSFLYALLTLFLFLDVTNKSTTLEGFYAPEAKELQAILERHQNILAGESTLLEKLKVPLANNISTPSLVLLPGTAAKYISIGLKDIQEALREQPINEELTITRIECDKYVEDPVCKRGPARP